MRSSSAFLNRTVRRPRTRCFVYCGLVCRARPQHQPCSLASCPFKSVIKLYRRTSPPSLSNICLIGVRGEQLSESVTSCTQLRVRRQPERQADRVGRMPRRDGEGI